MSPLRISGASLMSYGPEFIGKYFTVKKRTNYVEKHIDGAQISRLPLSQTCTGLPLNHSNSFLTSTKAMVVIKSFLGISMQLGTMYL